MFVFSHKVNWKIANFIVNISTAIISLYINETAQVILFRIRLFLY